MSVNGHDTVWTPEALELLETLAGLKENLTYREIAERMTRQLGVRYTKNSCIGRGRRMNFPPRTSRAQCKPSPSLQPTQAFAPIEPIEARRKPNGRDITMLQLRRGLCHWPSDGDRPPYTYCGRPTQLGNSFCAEHSRVAYNAPKRTWA